MQIRHFIEDHPAVHTLEIIAHDGAVLISLPAHLRTDTLRRKGRKKDPLTWLVVNLHRHLVADIEPVAQDRLKAYLQGRRSADILYRWNGQQGPGRVDSSGPELMIRLPKLEPPAEGEPAASSA